MAESRHEFRPGDVVRLKTGGPEMSVVVVNEALNLVLCQWFVGDEVRSSHFAPESLVLVAQKEGE